MMDQLWNQGYEVLLQYLTPADTAALRLVSRSWQALVNRSLNALQPYAVTTGRLYCQLSGTPSLMYRSPFQYSSVKHHPLDYGPSYTLHAIAGQFTSLHTLSIDCASKACVDFDALRLMPHLQRLHLAQFSFADEVFAVGLAHCVTLEALHLENQQVMLQMRSLRYLTGLTRLQELVIRPRGYIHVPYDSATGVAALGCLTGLTQLVLLTALKPPRHNTSGEASALPGLQDHTGGAAAAGGGEGGHPLYFSRAATLKLSSALCSLRGLKVLKLAGLSMLPPAIPSLTQLVDLSLERIGGLDRSAVASLCSLKQLSALTIITEADAGSREASRADAGANAHQHPAAAAAAAAAEAVADHGPDAAADGLANAGAAAAAVGGHDAAPGTALAGDVSGGTAAAAGAGSGGGSLGSWLPLLGFPALQELVLGSAHRSQQLNFTGSLTEKLRGQEGISKSSAADNLTGSGSGSSSSSSAGLGGGSGSGGRGMGRWYEEAGQAVSAYLCPTGTWSDLAQIQGLHNMVVVRSWHSAALTAVFPSFAAAVAAFMTWHGTQHGAAHITTLSSVSPAAPLGAAVELPPGLAPLAVSNWTRPAPASAALRPGASSSVAAMAARPGQLQGTSRQKGAAAQAAATGRGSAAGSSAASSTAGKFSAGGCVGVFHNHPNQGCFIPSMPQLLVVALQPSMRGLGALQRQMVTRVLLMAAAGEAGQVAGSRQDLALQDQGAGAWRPHSDSIARCLLLAQLRSSMHHSKLLLVLGASATSLTRLELTVDQSWPPSVLASLGQLERLKRLAVLKLDCGRQQPVEEMWDGLSRLVSLRWLCLRWLDRLPVAHLAPLTNLVALQLKNIDKPPGVAQLAEVLHGMQHLTALAIEGALLDADEDWLRDMVGLMRHGRWTSSWVEHILCREYRLRVLGSITAALLMSALLNSPKWPEMLLSALLAAVAGAIFVMAVAASLLQLLFDSRQPQQLSRTASEQDGPAQQQGPLQLDVLVRWGRKLMPSGLLGSWMLAAGSSSGDSGSSSRDTHGNTGGSSSSSTSSSNGGPLKDTWLSFMLRFAAVRASLLRGVGPTQLDTRRAPSSSIAAAAPAGCVSNMVAPPAVGTPAGAVDSAVGSSCATQAGSSDGNASGGSSSSRSDAPGSSTEEEDDNGGSSSSGVTPGFSSSSTTSITDPGSAFRRLRFLSLRRCTLSHSSNSVSNKLWKLSFLASQLAPGLGSQLIAVGLALVLWPLAVAAAISRIVATSGSVYSSSSSEGGLSSSSSGGGGSSSSGGGSSSGYSYNRHSIFAAWAWGWDLVCGLLQGAANRVEGAAAGCGPVVAVASCMPELRFLDLTWLNLEPWELQAIVQTRQLHYLGLSRQQVGVVMSREAVFARNCSRNRGQAGMHRRQHVSAAAADLLEGGYSIQGRAAGQRGTSVLSWLGTLVAVVSLLFMWPLYVWPVKLLWGSSSKSSSSKVAKGRQQQDRGAGVGVSGVTGVDMLGVDEEWPSMTVIESPSGFDEVIERELGLN